MEATQRGVETSSAFEKSDAEASRIAHATIPNFYEEGHVSGFASLVLSEHIEAATAGGCSVLLLASTLSALTTSAPELILRSAVVLGLCGGVAYGLRHWWAERWYARHYEREYSREAWELKNYPQGEREEMIGLYMHKGLARKDAESVIATMSAYHDFFVGIMMAEELELRAPLDRRDERAARSALCYAAAASLPALIGMLVGRYSSRRRVVGLDDGQLALRVVGVLSLTVLGVGRAAVSRLRKRTHAAESCALGLSCVALPYALAFFMGENNMQHQQQ